MRMAWGVLREYGREMMVLNTLLTAVLLLFGHGLPQVLAGMALGNGAAVLNFLFTGAAAEEAVLLEPKLAQRRMASSYFKRMLLLAAVLAAGFTLPVFDPLAAVLPLFFPKLALTIGTIFFGKGGN